MLLPTGLIIGIALAVYATTASIWMPTVVTSNEDQFGFFGVALALVTWFSGAALCVLIGACAGAVLAEDGGRVGRFIRAERPGDADGGCAAVPPAAADAPASGARSMGGRSMMGGAMGKGTDVPDERSRERGEPTRAERPRRTDGSDAHPGSGRAPTRRVPGVLVGSRCSTVASTHRRHPARARGVGWLRALGLCARSDGGRHGGRQPRGAAAEPRWMVLGGVVRPADHLVALPAAVDPVRPRTQTPVPVRADRDGGALGFAILIGTRTAPMSRRASRGSSTRGRPRSSRQRGSPWPPR